MTETVQRAAPVPWYRRAMRWGQTNITEIDPIRYDIDWWRRQWRRTRVQGIIVNAGGIVAYYPSGLPLQHRAEYLGERDLFGEIAVAAREEGLAVVARMDSNRAHAPFFEVHPDWFARKADGTPYRAGDLYVACIHSPYYEHYIPQVLHEIIDRYRPDGFADNSWSGLGRDSICYCDCCQRRFREGTGLALPVTVDWDDPAYVAWVRWSYQRRLAVWDLNNGTTRAAGGPDCLWVGMNSGDILGQSRSFRDYRAICARSELVFLDNQTRRAATGFQANGDMGKLIHGLLGWDKLVPESMAMYQSPAPTFRVASRPEPEARMWMVEGFAGGIQPWWHHIGAYHEDRRQYRTAESLMQWHERNETYLVNRSPVASVGIVWSQENVDFYGREAPESRTITPYWGMAQALLRARIPYVPVHADDIGRSDGLAVLVLPNVGALSDCQCAVIRQFVAAGGGLVATGETSLFSGLGERRADFSLADLFGAHATGDHVGSRDPEGASWDAQDAHSYLRLRPEFRATIDGPLTGLEPPVEGERHATLTGFDETDILPFGGRLELVLADPNAIVPLTHIPAFPIYPPETAWLPPGAEAGQPALVLSERSGQGRVAYLPASLDHAFAKDNLPDHGHLLANLVRWAADGRIPLRVSGTGLVDCHLYHQSGRLTLHMVNLSHTG
ncbi:MAG: Tat pathway signal protein, partial [Anaerolineae bacterium]|nr:Tat pathway signal protein [Anaerolineae bacterium]